MGLHKILKIVALLLAVAGIVSLVMVLLNGGGLDAQLYIAYITLALTFALAFIFQKHFWAASSIKGYRTVFTSLSIFGGITPFSPPQLQI